MKQGRTKNLKQLAGQLNLSVTTVSRALGGHADVAEATRRRVMDAAARANYVPNSAAKTLVTGRSGFVGLTLPLRDAQLFDPFLGAFVMGISEGLHSRGTDLFMATAATDQSELEVLMRVVESGRADGVVLNRIAESDERVDYLLNRRIPFVTHGRTLQTPHAYPWIDTDGEQAFAEAFDLLYGLGHRRFAMLSISEAMSFRYFRETGLEQAIIACNDNSVQLRTHHVPRYDKTRLTRVITDLLGNKDRPTAVLTLTDEFALAVLQQAALMGISVPEELSVIGFDNIPAAAFAPPGLTTFDQHIQKSAEQMAGLLLQTLDGSDNGSGQLIKPTLIKRGSHGKVPHV